MAKIIKILSLLVLFIVSNIYGLEKGCRMSQLDSKMKPLTALAGEGTWPENDKEVDEICRTYPRHFTETRNFVKKCAKGESKTILSVSVHSIEKMTMKLICKNKVERKKIMSASKCINSGKKTSSKCWNHNINTMTEVRNVTNSKDKIPLLCCSLMRWKECFIKIYDDIGAPVCTPDSIEYLDQYLYKAMIDPLNIFCSEYDDSDRCEKYKSFLSRSSNNRAKFGTPFPAIIDLFESL